MVKFNKDWILLGITSALLNIGLFRILSGNGSTIEYTFVGLGFGTAVVYLLSGWQMTRLRARGLIK